MIRMKRNLRPKKKRRNEQMHGLVDRLCYMLNSSLDRMIWIG